MKAQVFTTDGFLAVVLAVALVSSISISPGIAHEPIHLARACYDLTNAFYQDEEWYDAGVNLQNGSNASRELFSTKMAYYGELLSVSVSFNSFVPEDSNSMANQTERCCVPIIREDGKTAIGCFEVST